MARTTRQHQLMQKRARTRICDQLAEELERDIDDTAAAYWVRALVLQGVDLRVVQAEARDIVKALRAMGRRRAAT